jgi:hypothetical protein
MALEDAARATVLPLLRRGVGEASMRGNLRQQLEHVERHAGVREQLGRRPILARRSRRSPRRAHGSWGSARTQW